MKLLEYEAKQLLRDYGLFTPAGRLIRRGEAGGSGGLPAVIKAQVPASGRGKAGGVKVATSRAEYSEICEAMLGKTLLGHVTNTLLAEELIVPARELYLAIVLDRAEQALVLLAHHSGGVEIEQAATVRGPALKLALHGRPNRQLSRKVAEYLALPAQLHEVLQETITNLWTVCTKEDAALVEINPLMLTADGQLICADAKIELDDAAGFRHDMSKFEHQPISAQFVVLSPEGTIASLANGAGLAMATNDAIAAAGAEPANFFDVGGGTNAAEMTLGFDRIRALPNVRAIVVNIFGGITRCDEVAEAILAARAADKATPALYIRLAGTNAAEGAAMLRAAGIELRSSLGDCVQQALAEVRAGV